MTNIPTEELVARYETVYRHRVGCHGSTGFAQAPAAGLSAPPHARLMVIAGPAFGPGRACNRQACNDNDIRFAMLESIQPCDIPVWQTNMTDTCAHWGGLMTRSTRQAGGCGAIIDGGVRDVNDILQQDFPRVRALLLLRQFAGPVAHLQLPAAHQIGEITIHPATS